MTEFYTVALYEMSLGYGGPEEGGWYFDCGELADYPTRAFTCEKEALAFRAQAQEMANAFENDRGPTGYRSACSYYTLHAEIYSGHAPKSFPERRPHYE